MICHNFFCNGLSVSLFFCIPLVVSFYVPPGLQGLLMRDKADAESLDQLMKQRNLPENQQDAFKTGFTEGFMKSQALMQKTQGMTL